MVVVDIAKLMRFSMNLMTLISKTSFFYLVCFFFGGGGEKISNLGHKHNLLGFRGMMKL